MTPEQAQYKKCSRVLTVLVVGMMLSLPIGSIHADYTTPEHAYKCEETSGIRADSVGSDDLDDNNTVGYSASGIDGNACDFEKDNTESLSIDQADQNGWSLSGDWSFSFWLNLESQPGNAPLVSDGQSGDYSIYSDITTYDQLRLYSYNAAQSSKSDFTPAQTIALSTWYHVVYAYDQSVPSLKVYIDGSLVDTFTSVQSAINDSSGTLYIGASPDGTSNTIDGMIDEFYWYDSLLDNDDVASLYAGGSGEFYPFDTGTTSTSTTETSTASTTEAIYAFASLTVYVFGIAFFIFAFNIAFGIMRKYIW